MGQAGSSNRGALYQPLINDTDLSNDEKAIKYEEIIKATQKFHPNSLLGEGRNRRVYKGWIDEQKLTATKPGSGIAVAVKKLMDSDDMYLEHKEWVEDIKYTSQLHHPNLAKLIGYSFDKNTRFVLHEFIENGSLDHHLFQENNQPLPWATRIKVAIGAARVFVFLHGLEKPIILGTLGSSDILLDSDFNPKFSDIGRARRRLAYDNVHRATARAIDVRSYAHVSPEYIMTCRFYKNSDVYSFGVILLELMSGLRVFDDNRPKQKHNLRVWAGPYLRNKRKFSQTMDRRLGGEYPHEEAHKVAKVALQCLRIDPKLRPGMSEVLTALENL